MLEILSRQTDRGTSTSVEQTGATIACAISGAAYSIFGNVSV
jgi:hypothetical protein